MTNYEIKNATLYFFVKQLTGEQSVRESGAYTVHVYKYYQNGEIDADPVVSENRVSWSASSSTAAFFLLAIPMALKDFIGETRTS